MKKLLSMILAAALAACLSGGVSAMDEAPFLPAELTDGVEVTLKVETEGGEVEVTAMSYPKFARRVIGLVNEAREEKGLEAYASDEAMQAAALQRGVELTAGYGHTRPDGSKFSTVNQRVRAENIARGHVSAAHVMDAWLRSNGHRTMILSEKYQVIGVACVELDGVLHWVQVFGKKE